MGKTLLDITTRINAVLGIAPPVVLAPQPVPDVPWSQLPGNAAVYNPSNIGFEDLQLKGNGFDLYFAGGRLTKSGRLGNVFAPPMMINDHKGKNLIIDPVDGADAEVVERYGDTAWDFTMQGLLVDMENHEFPFYKIEQLRKVFDAANHFQVISQRMDALGVNYIYFREVDINGIQGFQDTVSFTLTARSIRMMDFLLNREAGL